MHCGAHSIVEVQQDRFKLGTATVALDVIVDVCLNTVLVLVGPRALLPVGSVAEGVADEYSDIDRLVLHDEMPSDETRSASHRRAS